MSQEELSKSRAKSTEFQIGHSYLMRSDASVAEEEELREKIDGVNYQAVELKHSSDFIRNDTNKSLKHLYKVKKEKQTLVQMYDSLNNKLVGLKKLQYKKQKNIRIMTNKIENIGEHFERA